jgi:adenylate cyclase
LPDFLLYDWAAAEAISPDGLVASDRLVTKATPVARWLDMSEDHAVFKLIQLLAPAQAASLYQKNRLDENCDDNLRCRRLRFSQPLYATSLNPDRLILPLSQLASCDENIAKHTAALLKNKLVILQATSPTESTDIMVTPMTVAMWGPQLMTPGAQFIVDQIETVLNQDFPRPPPPAIRIALIAGLALTSVLLGAYFSQTFLWLGGLAVFMIMVMLCFLNPLTQLWPVTAAMASYLCGALLMVAAQLISGFRQSHLLAEYLPKQVLTLLLPLPVNELFKHRRCNAVVLMSDLAGYTTLTGLLKDPEHVMNLMNDYLDATSIVLQDKYNGTLEAYVGDMVCYYWEYEPENAELTFKNALSGAIELALLQKTFFSSVTMRYRDILDPDVIEKVGKNINAGIGVTAGEVVKGNLGPKHGIKKFTILGDPINLASRIESLTRLFNTEIIVVGDFASTIAHEGLAVRRLAAVSVKGRAAPIILYALGVATDIRFAAEEVRAWELWSAAMEAGGDTQLHCPEIFRKDQQTILDWHQRGLQSENGVWVLHEK